MSGGGSTVRPLFAFAALAVLSALALRNVCVYRETLAARHDAVLASVQEPKSVSDSAAGNETRREFYALLERLGSLSDLHGKNDIGVFVSDDDFYEGAYIDRPQDTILERCAIQPFTIPAMTGLPLVSGLLVRGGQCRYHSYGYQYLPLRAGESRGMALQPCKLAASRGFRELLVIRREDSHFVSERIDCAAR